MQLSHICNCSIHGPWIMENISLFRRHPFFYVRKAYKFIIGYGGEALLVTDCYILVWRLDHLCKSIFENVFATGISRGELGAIFLKREFWSPNGFGIINSDHNLVMEKMNHPQRSSHFYHNFQILLWFYILEIYHKLWSITFKMIH